MQMYHIMQYNLVEHRIHQTKSIWCDVLFSWHFSAAVAAAAFLSNWPRVSATEREESASSTLFAVFTTHITYDIHICVLFLSIQFRLGSFVVRALLMPKRILWRRSNAIASKWERGRGRKNECAYGIFLVLNSFSKWINFKVFHWQHTRTFLIIMHTISSCTFLVVVRELVERDFRWSLLQSYRQSGVSFAIAIGSARSLFGQF